MRIFHAIYTVNKNSEELESILDGCLSRVASNKEKVIYIEKEDIGNRKFVYYRSENILTEEYLSDYRYPLYCSLIILLNIILRLTNIFTGISRDIVLVTTGIAGISLFLIPHLLTYRDYDFLSTSLYESQVFGVPHLYRSKLKLAVPSYIMFLIGVVNLWPLFIPDTNLLSVVVMMSLSLAILIFIRKDPNDQITAQLLYLFTVLSLPITAVVGNAIVYTQSFVYREQEIPIINELVKITIFESGRALYYHLSPHSPFWILFFNIIIFVVIGQKAPTVWARIVSNGPNRPNPVTISNDRLIRGAMFLLIGTYVISALLIPISVVFNLNLVNIESANNLVLIYSPLLIYGVFHTGIRIRRYLTVRTEMSTVTKRSSKIDSPDDQIELILSNEIITAAMSANVIGRDSVIIVNKSLAQDLQPRELRAVYYHELYHIRESHSKYNKLSNIPIFGQLLFLILVNPRKVYQNEFRADRFAAEKVGKEAIVGALQKAKKAPQLSESHDQVQAAQGSTLSFLILLTSVPVLSLYRPDKSNRIRQIKSNNN